jgi:hypothetical protein
MNKRPATITLISWIFIVLGSIGLLASLLPYANTVPDERITYLKAHWIVHLARFIAIVCGVFMLYGFNWARWLLVVWLLFHIVISALHSPLQLLVHGLLFGIALYLIFRSDATAYFRGPGAKPPQIPA